MAALLRRSLAGALLALAAAAPGATAAPNVAVSHSGWFWGAPQPQGNTLRSLDFMGNRGYAAGDFGTILRTDDGGATWAGLRTDVTVNLTRLRMISPDSFVVGGGCSVRRSDDGGRSFRRLPWTASDERCSSQVAAFAFPSSAVGYLQLADGNVLRSGDGGLTWSRRTVVPGTGAAPGGGTAGPTDMVFTREDTGFVSTNTGFVYETTDGGSTWTPSIDGWETPLRGLAFPDPEHGFAVGDDGAIVQTGDGGASWGVSNYDFVHNLQSIDCADAQTCLSVTRDGDQLLRTVDGGFNWTALAPSSDRIRTVAFAAETRVAAVGDAGATVVSNDDGLRFTRVGGHLVGVYTGLRAGSTTAAYAFGRGGALAKTLDGGSTWHAIDVATPDDVKDVSFPNTTVGFALDAVGQLLRTDNGGVSWQILNTGTNTIPDAVMALDRQRVMLVGPTGVRVSLNGGEDFTPIRVKAVQQAGLVAADHVGRTAFVYGPTAMFASANGGSRWARWRIPFQLHARKVRTRKGTKIVHFYTRSIEQVDLVSRRLAFALDDLGRIWRTRDASRHWRQVPAVGSEQGFDLRFSDPLHGWLAVSEFGDSRNGWALRTSDGGASWRPQLVDAAGIVSGGLTAPGPAVGFALVAPDRLLATTTGGDRGAPTRLTLGIRRKRPGKPGTLKLDGRLRPAKGGEQVVVSLRPLGDSSWLYETVQVATNGTFTVVADVQRSTQFVAQWAGDDTRLGDGTHVLTVKIKRKKCPANLPKSKWPKNCIPPKTKAAAARFIH